MRDVKEMNGLEMRQGFIQSYNRDKRIGTIASEPDRFWFHADRIAKGPINPEINSAVLFEISPKPVLPGKLAVAISIIVLEDGAAGTDELAGQKANTGVK
jgi:hypothetical protein